MRRHCSSNGPLPARFGEYELGSLRPHHIVQIARLERSFFPEPLSAREILALSLSRNTRYIVATNRRSVCAYIGFELLGPTAHTISMGVAPDHRRRGLAAEIQRRADEVAKRDGARWFMGEVRISNDPQLRLLRRLGWKEIGVCRRFFKNGEDAVVVWNLL